MQQPHTSFGLLARVLGWFFWACLGLAVAPVQAQTYAYRNDVFAYDTPSGAATSVAWHATGASPACTGYPLGDDDWSDITFPGGFTFTFGGTSYSSVRVYSNGMLAFPTDVSGFHRNFTPQALPITTVGTPGPTSPCTLSAVPKNLMVAYWVDIIAGTAGGITGAAVKYEVLGVAPSRRLVISWDNVALYGNAATRYSFQVALYESTAGVNGNFRYQYTTGSTTGVGATVGVQLTTTDFTQYAYNQNFIDTSVGTSILWYPANQLATKSAEYRFDESAWLGLAGEIKDTSGNSKHASRVGLATSVAPGFFPGGKLCRGGSFTSNTLNTTIDAVATPMVPGNQGSVDFWFNSNVNWNSAAAMLLDATTVANRPFFLLKSATGALTFVVTDTVGTSVTATAPAQTYALNTWHHIGVAWNVRAGTNQTTLQIFLDGALQNGVPTRGTTNGFMPGLSSIYVGDNRTSGVTPAGGTPNGANGSIDEVYVYAVEISAPQALADKNLARTTCTSLDHFHIKHDGAVSSCTAPASITIEAHDATHALFSLAGTSMSLSTSPARGTWSNVASGAINPLTAIGAGTGTASYTFAGESTVTFGLSDNLTEALNINVASGAITEHTGTASACVISDYTNTNPGTTTCDDSRSYVCAVPFGFNCVESGANALTGHLFTKLAGTAFAFDVVALKDANSDGIADAVETLYASDVDKNVTVELVDGSGATACASRVAISPAVSQTLSFTKAAQPTELGRKSTANMTVTKAYPDLRCRVTDANQSPSIVSCSTDDFAVRPSAITLATSAIALPPSSTATPIIKAGANFTLQATTSAGTNYAGSLARDVSKLTAQTTSQDTSQMVGGVVGTLNPATLVANAAAINATYSEVGHLYLAPGTYRDDAYTAVDIAAGDCIVGSYADTLPALPAAQQYGCSIGNKTSVSFGRFIPDHFDTVVTQGCVAGTFTYSAQPFTVAVTARSTAGVATQNYAGSFFAKSTTLSNAGVLTNLTGNTLAASAFVAGVGTANGVTYTFSPTPATAPLALTLRALDTDAVTSSGLTEGIANIRGGRLQLQNAYGSEFLALQIPLAIQYWNGSWQQNTADTCTNITATQFAWAFPTGTATRPNNLVPACKSTATVTGSSPNYTVNLSAPGAGNAGWADLTLNLKAIAAGSACTTASPAAATTANTPWLLFNWTGTVGNPVARATFGTFGKRTNPLIYRRENY